MWQPPCIRDSEVNEWIVCMQWMNVRRALSLTSLLNLLHDLLWICFLNPSGSLSLTAKDLWKIRDTVRKSRTEIYQRLLQALCPGDPSNCHNRQVHSKSPADQVKMGLSHLGDRFLKFWEMKIPWELSGWGRWWKESNIDQSCLRGIVKGAVAVGREWLFPSVSEGGSRDAH